MSAGTDGRISFEQSRELGGIGQALLVAAGREAKQFCDEHGLPEEGNFNAALFTIIETMNFLAMVGSYDTQIERRRAVDEMCRSLRKLLFNYYRDTHPKGPTQ
jgi:hypothetical protein